MYEILVFSIFLMLPLINVGVTFENSHINSSLYFKLSSNCNSCLIIFIFSHHPFAWMILILFLGNKKINQILFFWLIFISSVHFSSNRYVIGGQGWIRTIVPFREQIYSLPPLATRPSVRRLYALFQCFLIILFDFLFVNTFFIFFHKN